MSRRARWARPRLEPFPLVCRNDERHHVELPRSIDALRIAVDVVGDAVLANRAPRVVTPCGELVGADGFDAADETLAVLAQGAGPVEHLVERPGSRPVVPQQAPREQRTGRQRGIAECAHRNPRTCRSVRLGAVGRRRSSVNGKSGFRSSAGDLHPSRRVADRLEAREPPALGLVRVDGEGLEAPAAGMRDVIRAAAKRPLVPRIDEIECERRVNADGRVQAARRVPRPIANAGDELADGPRWMQGNRAAVARKEMARFRHSCDLDLQPLDR